MASLLYMCAPPCPLCRAQQTGPAALIAHHAEVTGAVCLCGTPTLIALCVGGTSGCCGPFWHSMREHDRGWSYGCLPLHTSVHSDRRNFDVLQQSQPLESAPVVNCGVTTGKGCSHAPAKTSKLTAGGAYGVAFSCCSLVPLCTQPCTICITDRYTKSSNGAPVYTPDRH
jgi:hypothetical protein